MNNITAEQAALAGGIIGSTVIFSFIILALWYILLVIAGWKIFEKAGEKGWKSLIPFYNIYILYKIVNMKGWFWGMLCLSILTYIIMLATGYNPSMTTAQMSVYNYAANPLLLCTLLVVGVIGVVVEIMYAYRTAKVFGHGIGYTIGLIFLPNIFWLILGFGKSKYDKKALK